MTCVLLLCCMPCVMNTLVWYFKYYAVYCFPVRSSYSYCIVWQGSANVIRTFQVTAVGCDHMFDIVLADCQRVIHVYTALCICCCQYYHNAQFFVLIWAEFSQACRWIIAILCTIITFPVLFRSELFTEQLSTYKVICQSSMSHLSTKISDCPESHMCWKLKRSGNTEISAPLHYILLLLINYETFPINIRLVIM